MNLLLKKSDRVILLVGLFLGCIALSQPYLKGLLVSRSSAGLSEVNGKPVKLEDVNVRVPRLIKGGHKVDINAAGKEELIKLTGIGSVLADRIIAYRAEAGGFSSLDELKKVRGIGSATLNKLEKGLTIKKEAS